MEYSRFIAITMIHDSHDCDMIYIISLEIYNSSQPRQILREQRTHFGDGDLCLNVFATGHKIQSVLINRELHWQWYLQDNSICALSESWCPSLTIGNVWRNMLPLPNSLSNWTKCLPQWCSWLDEFIIFGSYIQRSNPEAFFSDNIWGNFLEPSDAVRNLIAIFDAFFPFLHKFTVSAKIVCPDAGIRCISRVFTMESSGWQKCTGQYLFRIYSRTSIIRTMRETYSPFPPQPPTKFFKHKRQIYMTIFNLDYFEGSKKYSNCLKCVQS